MKRKNERHDPFEGLRPARPRAGLRARTLAAARQTLTAGPAQLDVWTRIARSRVLRLAWAAAVLALALAHLALSFPRRTIERPETVTPSFAARAEPEVIDLVRMAAIDPSAPLGLGSARSMPSKENGS